MTQTDLEITIQVEIPSSFEKKGSAALPLKTLLEIRLEAKVMATFI